MQTAHRGRSFEILVAVKRLSLLVCLGLFSGSCGSTTPDETVPQSSTSSQEETVVAAATVTAAAPSEVGYRAAALPAEVPLLGHP